MVNTQKWLDEKYSNKSQAEKINLLSDTYFDDKSGELIITDFSNLKEVYGAYIFNITKLTISNCPRLEKVDIGGFKNNQDLIINNCPNLRKLYCYDNKLVSLNLTDCPSLQIIIGFSNLLTEINLPWKKLEKLDLRDNNFPEQNLSVFSKFTNLKVLWIGNHDQERFKQNIYNHFVDSLEHLQGLAKLVKLDIRNTDINSGLEYLSESVKEFYCSADLKKDAKVSKFSKAIGSEYNIAKWKKSKKDVHSILVRVEDIQKTINRLFGGYSQKEITKLKDPDQLGKWGYIVTVGQWTGRGISAAGGVLVIKGTGDYDNINTINGGILAIIGPFIEAGFSYLEKRYYDKNENKWDRFVVDTKKLWNDYQELVDILEPFEVCDNFLEWVKKLKEIKELTDQFPREELSQNENIIITKNHFAQDLQKNWETRKIQWKRIGEKLVEINKKQKDEALDKNEELEVSLINHQKETSLGKIIKLRNQEETVVNLGSNFEQNQEYQTRIIYNPSKQN